MICRLCLTEGTPEALAYLQAYVDALPDSLRASDALRESRLRQCEHCELLEGLTCRACGCFVQARAAKADLRCPHPSGEKW